MTMTTKDRPPICPCPQTCTPVFNAMAFDEHVRTGDMAAEGYSGECIGRMASETSFTVGDVDHRNDLNRCVFTPLKGILRFQENVGDLESSVHVLLSALQVLQPLECVECGESRVFGRFIVIGDRWYCHACAARLGLIEYLTENAFKPHLAKYRNAKTKGRAEDPISIDGHGIDVHGGLRVRLEYEDHVFHARYSAENDVDPRIDVEQAITGLRLRLSYLEAWLTQWRQQEVSASKEP